MTSVSAAVFDRFGRIAVGLCAVVGISVVGSLAISPRPLLAAEWVGEPISGDVDLQSCDSRKTDNETAPWTGDLSAAEKGDAEQQYGVGENYAFGECGRQKDEAEALRWLSKAAEQGHVRAQLQLASMYEHGRGGDKDEKLAAEWYRKAADQGDVHAQVALAYLYLEGRGVERREVEAAHWFMEAAKQNDAEAQFNLGLMFELGQGVQNDEKQAGEWYRKAASDANAAMAETYLEYEYRAAVGCAETFLGELFFWGYGVKRDYAEAAKWMTKAANLGIVEAERLLANMYALGLGLPKDEKLATYWSLKAAYAESSTLSCLEMFHRGRRP